MALKALPPAFISRICETAPLVPFFTPRHLIELSLHDAPKPDDLREPRLWASARTRAIRAALKDPLSKGILGTVPVNLGKLFPVAGPLYRSTPSDPLIDVAEIRACLDGRAVDFGLPDATHIYYGLSENPAADGGRAELRQYFYHLSFIENKALAQATSIYLYLLSTEPEVAATFRFHRLAPAPFVRFDDILNPDNEPLERHWIPGGPEADSCVFIDRGSGPVRVLFFVRQLPDEALVQIKYRFDEAGQAFELW